MSSSITINGQSYDLESGLAEAELNHLMFLKTNANTGLGTITKKLQQFGKVSEQNPDDPTAMLEALDDVDTLNAFRAIVWLLRTKAGERAEDGKYLTIDAANEGVSLANFGDADLSDVEPETADQSADPTSPDVAPEPVPSS